MTATEGSELATYRQALVDALQVNGHLRGVMHKRLGLPLTFTPDQLDEALGKLTETVERLTAGADPTPPTEGVWLSPAQWIHRWNQLSAEQRLERARHVIDNAQAATHCLTSGHDARLTWLETRAAVAAKYEAALEEHGLLPDCPGFRTAAGLAADGSLPGRLHSLEEVAAELDADLDGLGDEVAAEHYWEHRDDPVDPADVETVKVERPKLATTPHREHAPATVALHDCKGDASCCGICTACQKGDCDSCNGCDGCPEGPADCDAPVGDGELMCGDYAAHGSNRCSAHTEVAGGAA